MEKSMCVLSKPVFLLINDLMPIWVIPQKRMRARFEEHTKTIKSIAFSPNGRFLVTGSNDSVRVWNLRDGSSKVMPVSRRPGSFLSVAFRPDGRYIAGGDSARSILIWDSRRHKLVAKWQGHPLATVSGVYNLRRMVKG